MNSAEAGDLEKRQGFFLPHWRHDRAIYNVVFRLRDSLQREVLERFEQESDLLERRAKTGQAPKEEAARLRHRVSERVEAYLDAGHGECLMKDPRVADIVEGAFRHFDGERYRLHAWAVMANHVHTIVEPSGGRDLSTITHSWKSFSTHQANKLIERSGEMWMRESDDQIIRSEASCRWLVRYVLDNPAKGKLSNWKWFGPCDLGAPTEGDRPGV
jgi:REP element-mobilizing transposase RayT